MSESSEPMTFTLPTHGRIYAHSSHSFNNLHHPPTSVVPGSGNRPQSSSPVLPRPPLNSVPPYLPSHNRRLLPCPSPPSLIPNVFYTNNNLAPSQPTTPLHCIAPSHSPVLSYVSFVPNVPSPMIAPMPQAPIPDLNRTFINPSPSASSHHSLPHIQAEPPRYDPPPHFPNVFIPPPFVPARSASHIRSNSHCNDVHTPPVNSLRLSATSYSNFPLQDNFLPVPPVPPIPQLHPHSRKPPTLPSTKDLPKLTGKRDWGAWNVAITNLILNQ